MILPLGMNPYLPTPQTIGNSQKPKYNHHSSPMFNPENVIGLSFFMNKREYGQQFCGMDVQITGDHELLVNNNPTKQISCIYQ